jgi:hypothetical protein
MSFWSKNGIHERGREARDLRRERLNQGGPALTALPFFLPFCLARRLESNAKMSAQFLSAAPRWRKSQLQPRMDLRVSGSPRQQPNSKS